MKKTSLIIFALVALASAGVFAYYKKKDKKPQDETEELPEEEAPAEEIKDSINEGFKPDISGEGEKVFSEEAPSAESIFEYASRIKDLGYIPVTKNKPHIRLIPPDSIGEDEDYDFETLIYYSDNVVTDANGYPMYDFAEYIGSDFRDYFGSDEYGYEEGQVCVRNDKLKIEYEILYDSSEFKELLAERPYLAEDYE